MINFKDCPLLFLLQSTARIQLLHIRYIIAFQSEVYKVVFLDVILKLATLFLIIVNFMSVEYFVILAGLFAVDWRRRDHVIRLRIVIFNFYCLILL